VACYYKPSGWVQQTRPKTGSLGTLTVTDEEIDDLIAQLGEPELQLRVPWEQRLRGLMLAVLIGLSAIPVVVLAIATIHGVHVLLGTGYFAFLGKTAGLFRALVLSRGQQVFVYPQGLLYRRRQVCWSARWEEITTIRIQAPTGDWHIEPAAEPDLPGVQFSPQLPDFARQLVQLHITRADGEQLSLNGTLSGMVCLVKLVQERTLPYLWADWCAEDASEPGLPTTPRPFGPWIVYPAGVQFQPGMRVKWRSILGYNSEGSDLTMELTPRDGEPREVGVELEWISNPHLFLCRWYLSRRYQA